MTIFMARVGRARDYFKPPQLYFDPWLDSHPRAYSISLNHLRPTVTDVSIIAVRLSIGNVKIKWSQQRVFLHKSVISIFAE